MTHFAPLSSRLSRILLWTSRTSNSGGASRLLANYLFGSSKRSQKGAYRIARGAIISLLFGLLPVTSYCQNSLTGYPPFNNIAGGINEGNLNNHLSIPVVSKPGVGLSFNDSLVYDSNVWNQYRDSYGALHWGLSYGTGWKAPSEGMIGWTDWTWTPLGTTCGFYTFHYHDPSGTVRIFPGTNIGDGVHCGPTSQTVAAIDGSGYLLTGTYSGQTAPFISIQDRAGNIISAPVISMAAFNNGTIPNVNGSGNITDPKGNVMSTNGTTFTDTLGYTALTASGGVYTYTGGNGSAQVKTNSSNHTVSTNFLCSGVADFPPTAVSLVDSVLLPDGTTYSFTYDSTGRVNQVTLPAGGVMKYTYTGVNCTDGTPNSLTKKVSTDGVTFDTWTYTRTGTPPATSTTTIQDPSGNTTVINFAYYYDILRSIYTGAASGTPKEQITHCYNFTSSTPCATSTGPSSAAQAGTSPQVLSVLTSFDGGPNSQRISYFPPKSDLPTEVDLYDFGASTPSRKISTPYGSWNGTSCVAIGNNISDRVCYTNVTDGSGNYISSSNNTYDAKGNLTAVAQPLNGGTWLTTSYSYYSNGALQQVTQPNGAITTYSNMACNAAFPQTISEPLTLSRSLTWDCNGGVVTSVTDENKQPTTITKSDPFWRTTSVQAPYNSGTLTTTSYAYSATTVESSLIFNNSQSTVDVQSKVDGLGRLVSTERMTAPKSAYDNVVQYGYGWTSGVGPFKSQTLPGGSKAAIQQFDAIGRIDSVTDAAQTPGSISFTHSQNDLMATLSSPNVIKQTEYDGLGRIKSVCEITPSLPGNPACGQTTGSSHGYLTTYAYDTPVPKAITVTQNANGASQQRIYYYDGPGRLTKEINPESGTTTYVYDITAVADICGAAKRSSPGDLVQKTDANGTITCYDYDPLHRVTDIGNSIYSTSNPCQRFRYDNTTGVLGKVPTGITINNTLGRLAEAETDDCTTSKPITDEWFSYSPRGELTDLYESTPDSVGFYHVKTSYWENGALKQLSGLGLPTLNFGVDGEGRTNTVADAGTGVAPVLSTGFDTAGHVTGVQFGSGDTASFGFDNNTGRETSYSEKINATSTMTGTMTWNSNGTLKTLAIVDPFNATDQQTCNYGYDDLGRSNSVNCGSPWSQTFSFDAFGNINKSGSSAFVASYNSTTNRETLVGSLVPTYDSNGNMTYDPSGVQHHYVWNASNKLASVDSNAEQFTYDALGRMVEDNKNGVYSEFVYALGTKLAIMSGQTLSKGFVPLPGGTQVKYVSTGISTYRVPDWLGSLRIGSNPNRTYAWSVAFAPYGERYAAKNSPAFTFTGQNEDNVNGLYDFLFREESNAQGRWISPDPAGLAAANFNDPQSFNRYAYARNSPVVLTDPTGLDPWADQGCAFSTPDGSGSCGSADNPIDMSLVWPPPDTQSPLDPQPPMPPAPMDLSSASAFAWDSWTSDTAMGSIGEAIFHGPGNRVWSDAAGTMNALTGAYAGGLAAAGTAVISAPTAISLAARGLGAYYGLFGAGTGVVLGEYSEHTNYVEAAGSMGANALNVTPSVYSFFNNAGAWWTLNQSFLSASVFRGQQFFMSSPVLGAEGNYGLELQYLMQQGIGPEQWRMVQLPY